MDISSELVINILPLFLSNVLGVKTNIIGLMVADLVPQSMRGTAYGFYNALLGILDLSASLIAGIHWQGRKH